MEAIGGYRIVRRLGSGNRAEVFLGFADASPGTSGTGDHPRVAIKRFRQAVDRSSIETEIAALARVSSIHVVKLIDLATDPVVASRPCLILQRLASPSVARLFDDRLTIAVGEAVTILAPIASAVGQLHQAGVCHGNISTTNILFDPAGAPVLVGFGSAQIVWPDQRLPSGRLPPALVSGAPAIAADLAQLAALATAVLERTGPSANRSAASLLAWLQETEPGFSSEFSGQLVDRLFDLAPALPISFLRRRADGDIFASVRAGFNPPSGGLRSDDLQQSPLAGSVSGRPRGGPHDWVAKLVGRVLGRLPTPVKRITTATRQAGELFRQLWRRLPKPARFAVGLATILLVFVVVPFGSTLGASDPTPTSRSSALAAPLRDRVVDSQSATSGVDDPLDAAAALFAARAECLRTRSMDCLEGVEQPGSAAFNADTALLASHRDDRALAEPDLSAGACQLIDRMGDTALLNVRAAAADGQATVLLLKTDVGWRIRDIVWANR